jgi:hypothetical protein
MLVEHFRPGAGADPYDPSHFSAKDYRIMKSFLSFVAVCALACTLTGCNSTKTDGAASPGAVGEKKSECCAEKADASMGAVGEKKSGCCAEKAKTDASMGAVSEKKEGGCCASKAKTDASMGAVSEKSGTCTKTCPVTGKPVG